jgi:adenylyltransferase/sulfurtransferase
MTLTQIEKERYNRHIITTGFGEEGQLKLKTAKVLVIGAGGLGCPVIQYLVAAGVGKIGIVDGDTVSLSNLQRQILYATDEIGQSKVSVAGSKMTRLNPSVTLELIDEFLTEELADRLFANYDVVVGATDNYTSRYLIDAKSRQYAIPFVHGSIFECEGQLSVFNYKGGNSYADLFGEASPETAKPAGVIGAIPGIIGSLMALETIKILTGIGSVNTNKLLLYNGLDNSFRQIAMN